MLCLVSCCGWVAGTCRTSDHSETATQSMMQPPNERGFAPPPDLQQGCDRFGVSWASFQCCQHPVHSTQLHTQSCPPPVSCGTRQQALHPDQFRRRTAPRETPQRTTICLLGCCCQAHTQLVETPQRTNNCSSSYSKGSRQDEYLQVRSCADRAVCFCQPGQRPLTQLTRLLLPLFPAAGLLGI